MCGSGLAQGHTVQGGVELLAGGKPPGEAL